MVVRYNYTFNEVFENVMLDLESRNIQKINIILNDIAIPKSRYGYGYGYGYGYLQEDKKKSKARVMK
jgi:hypothetical protein